MQPNFNIRQIKLIIGLGNPGKEYLDTYHNVGHLFIDYLKRSQLKTTNYKLKTDCFMNQSGGFVVKILKKYNLKPKALLVVHDDSDIELGKYKFSFGRGAAGHKGVESVIKALGTKNFWRLRIGIRPKKAGLPAEARRAKAGDLVLKKISAKDKKIFEKVFKITTSDIINDV